MTETVSKRLFIGGLSNSVSEDEVSERFSRFGKVTNLSMKSRQDEEGNCIKVFAHLNIEGSEENVKKCFSTYQGTKWKGSVLKLQYAKENFLTRLEQEREATQNDVEAAASVKQQKAGGEWKAPEFTKFDGPAVPGTPVPGKKDWVVGKYGRVLPVLNVKKSYKIKAIKHDPSKFCHSAKVFKDTDGDASSVDCEKMTWEISDPDSEITKKRKGEFPPSSTNKKPKKPAVNPYASNNMTSRFQTNSTANNNDFEVVKIGQSKSASSKHLAPSRFDSDYEEEDMEYDNKVSNTIRQKSSKSPLHSNPSNPLTHSKIESGKVIEKPFKETSGEKVTLSSDTNTNMLQNERITHTPQCKSKESAFVSDARRKVPEFAGLGMLKDVIPNNSPQVKEAKSTIEISSSNIVLASKNTDNSKKKAKSSSGTNMAENKPVHQISSSEPQTSKNSPDSKKPKGKKSVNKTEVQDSVSPSEEKKTKAKTKGKNAVKSPKLAAESDGQESASSADTDEIISQCKNKDKSSNISVNNKRSSLLSSNSLLDQSVDLSEFSASAPEILSNSLGNSSHAVPSVDSDSYDSDLDSNDFELVAKKLSEKIDNSQPSSVNTSLNKQPPSEPSLKSSKKSVKKSTTIIDIMKEPSSSAGKSVHQTSSSEHQISKNSPDSKKPKGKKSVNKTEVQDSVSPSEEKKTKAKTKVKKAVKSPKLVAESDGQESASSADTDEIISRCKIKDKSSNISVNNKRNSSLNSNSLLDQSVDLSEFSASAPEILSNSLGSSSHVVPSVDSDSYDSDLDSNDFELVAKKLSEKVSNLQSSSVNTSLNKQYPNLEPSSKSSEKSVKKSSMIIDKKKEPNSSAGKSVGVKLKENSFLHKKLLKIANSNIETCDKKTNPDQLSKKKENKHAADNEKRLQALDEQRKLKEHQQQIVRTALENVDTTSTKRIVFSSSDEDDVDDNESKKSIPASEKPPTKADGTKSKKQSTRAESPKLTLLDSSSSDESDYGDMFKSKPQFEGKKGEKLMAMQRKIGDSRFQLDEKFMDSEDSDNEEEEEEKENDSFTDERKMNLEVLESVVGKSKMDQFTAKMKRKTKHIVDMNAVRFDPTKIKIPDEKVSDDSSEKEEEEEEAEMEVDVEESSPTETKATQQGQKTKEDKAKKKEGPSKSTVTMASSLVDMLKSQAKEDRDAGINDESFSLLQQFDQNMNEEEEETNDSAKEDTDESSLDEDSEEEDSSKSESESSEQAKTDTDESLDENSDEEDSSKSESESSEQAKMDTDESSDEDSDEEDRSESESSRQDKVLSKAKGLKESMTLDTNESSEDDSDKEDTHITETKSKMSGTKTEVMKKSPSKEKAIEGSKKDAEGIHQEDNSEEHDELHRITSSHDPKEEKEKALFNAGKRDIRLTKDDWLQNWDEIRTDLMKMCRRKHKDAGKRKRLLNEKKRRKDFLKNVKRKPWMKQ